MKQEVEIIPGNFQRAGDECESVPCVQTGLASYNGKHWLWRDHWDEAMGAGIGGDPQPHEPFKPCLVAAQTCFLLTGHMELGSNGGKAPHDGRAECKATKGCCTCQAQPAHT